MGPVRRSSNEGTLARCRAGRAKEGSTAIFREEEELDMCNACVQRSAVRLLLTLCYVVAYIEKTFLVYGWWTLGIPEILV